MPKRFTVQVDADLPEGVSETHFIDVLTGLLGVESGSPLAHGIKIQGLQVEADYELRQKALQLAAQPGVHTICLYEDGIEFVGSQEDQDDSVGFLRGTFTPEQVRGWTPLHVVDERGQGLEVYPRGPQGE